MKSRKLTLLTIAAVLSALVIAVRALEAVDQDVGVQDDAAEGVLNHVVGG